MTKCGILGYSAFELSPGSLPEECASLEALRLCLDGILVLQRGEGICYIPEGPSASQAPLHPCQKFCLVLWNPSKKEWRLMVTHTVSGRWRKLALVLDGLARVFVIKLHSSVGWKSYLDVHVTGPALLYL